MNQHVATTLTASPTPISTALQVKKTMPKQFELKFLGSMSGLAPTLKSTLTDEQGTKVPPQPVVSPDSLLAAACQPPFPPNSSNVPMMLQYFADTVDNHIVAADKTPP